jgi:hypothetical protein
LTDLRNIKLQDFSNGIVRFDLLENLPTKFKQLIYDYFDEDSPDRNFTFEKFSETTIPGPMRKKLNTYWNKSPLDEVTEAFLYDYVRKSMDNFNENKSKANLVQRHSTLMVSTLSPVSIALGLLLWSLYVS